MVRLATDDNVASADRILPMLDLCQLYWDTNTLLIQACVESRPRWLERSFFVPNDADAATFAMEIRFAIQEQFAIRNKQVSARDKLQTQSYVMLSPGLKVQCLSDTCSCQFDEGIEAQIVQAVSSRTGVSQLANCLAIQTQCITAAGSDGCIQ